MLQYLCNEYATLMDFHDAVDSADLDTLRSLLSAIKSGDGPLAGKLITRVLEDYTYKVYSDHVVEQLKTDGANARVAAAYYPPPLNPPGVMA